MNRMKSKIIVITLMLAFVGGMLSAENRGKRFSFELNSGVSFATQKFSDKRVNPGFGFEGVFKYMISTNSGVYAGWGWNRFTAEEFLEPGDVSLEETGYIFGVQHNIRLRNCGTLVFFRAGGLYNHIETENSAGELISDSGHGLGWQVAAGVELPLNDNWSIAPGIKFNSLVRDFKYKYFSLRIGLTKYF
jgi:opacity protein-like surface antigen